MGTFLVFCFRSFSTSQFNHWFYTLDPSSYCFDSPDNAPLPLASFDFRFNLAFLPLGVSSILTLDVLFLRILTNSHRVLPFAK